MDICLKTVRRDWPHLVTAVNPLGNTSTTTYDADNRTTANINPLGRRRRVAQPATAGSQSDKTPHLPRGISWKCSLSEPTTLDEND